MAAIEETNFGDARWIFFFSWFHVSSNKLTDLLWVFVGGRCMFLAVRTLLPSFSVSAVTEPPATGRGHLFAHKHTCSQVRHLQKTSSCRLQGRLIRARLCFVQVTGWTLTSQELLGKTQSTFHKDAQHRVKFLPNSYRAIFFFFFTCFILKIRCIRQWLCTQAAHFKRMIL